MIPKKIHYCWFGGNPLPEIAVKCVESWKKYCPDYEIIEWNENNSNLDSCEYLKDAYAAKKWAFVSDVVRLNALVEQGGIYMDIDVEVVKPIDSLLQYEAVAGFEANDAISTAFMGCIKGHKMFKEFLESYEGERFVYKEGEMGMETNVRRFTNICEKYNYKPNNEEQMVNDMKLFPREYFSPKDYETKKLKITENTYAIHHFDGSWLSEEEQYIQELKERYYKKVPCRLSGLAASFVGNTKYHGLGYAIKKSFKWLIKR